MAPHHSSAARRRKTFFQCGSGSKCGAGAALLHAVKLLSWNVNGMRSILGKGFGDYLAREEPDVLCIQETKARREQVEHGFQGWHVFWNAAQRPGYSGTAVLSRKKPLSVENGIGRTEHDTEGRVITAEFPDFFLVNVYTPNSQRELTRLDYRTRGWTPAFIDHLVRLKKRKPVVFCGDMNVAHREIDLARPKENTRNAGFTAEEREAFDRILGAGFVDSFREFEPGGGHYTWWSYQNGARERNIGWRIDYFCVSAELAPAMQSACIQPLVMGSDHCPVGLALDV
jgi:exodeoxyribonuclease-3